MISQFTPPGIQIVALRSGEPDVAPEIVAGQLYTVRGMVLNRHWKTKEPDPHVLLEETVPRIGRHGEIGYPRDVFEIPALKPVMRELEAAV
jgi:hypothetical protein